jgi:hypothetical protein
MSLALRDRPIGRPGRAERLAKLLDDVRKHDRVEFAAAWTSRTTGGGVETPHPCSSRDVAGQESALVESLSTALINRVLLRSPL